jgi:hypothetical protein
MSDMVTLPLLERKTAATNWPGLFRIGGVAALIFIVYSLSTMVILFVIGGPPETAVDTFKMLAENKLTGLLRLDVLTALIVPLYYPIFLSISLALRKKNTAIVMLGGLLAFAGITLFLATPSVFSLVNLNDKYAAATTAVQQERLLAAGEALLASDMWHGTGAMTGGVLMLLAALILSAVMLNSGRFTKATAYVGLLTHGLDLARIFLGLIVPQLGIILMAIAGPLYLVWFPLLARDLFRLGRKTPEAS